MTLQNVCVDRQDSIGPHAATPLLSLETKLIFAVLVLFTCYLSEFVTWKCETIFGTPFVPSLVLGIVCLEGLSW